MDDLASQESAFGCSVCNGDVEVCLASCDQVGKCAGARSEEELDNAWTVIREAMAKGDETTRIALSTGIGGLVHWALFQEKDHPARKAVLLALNDALASGRARARTKETEP
jgi:hypothetical protein